MSAPNVIPIRIRFIAGLWRLSSADGRLSGAFTDLKAARRWAVEAVELHPDYALPA